MLFNGVLLGITGLLAIFLTAIFAANHRAIFPATALVAWAVLAYFCVDFGFWNKLFPVGAGPHRALSRGCRSRRSPRASCCFSTPSCASGFGMAGSGRCSGLGSRRNSRWSSSPSSIPPSPSGLARASLLAVAGVGAALIAYFALRGQDRALSLIPSWMLLIVWLFGAAMVVLGKLSGDLVVSGLVAGLVLILVLLGFTVTQFAFRSGSAPLSFGPPSLVQMKSLAVDGSGAAVFQWNAGRDQITVANEVEQELGLEPGALNVAVEDFLQHMHAADRERFRLMLWSLQEKQGGDLQTDFRLRRQRRHLSLVRASRPCGAKRECAAAALYRA